MPDEPRDAGAGVERTEPPRILLIDDDQVDRLVVKRSLTRGGFVAAFDEADSAMLALERLGQSSYDAVLLDYNIPGGDGLTLLRGIRSAGLDMPVIMLTGQGDEQIAVELMKAGASDYLPKSALTPERLVQSLRYALSLGRARDEARRAQDELRATAERLRLAADSASIGTWDFDPVSGAMVWDPRTREMFGIAPDAVLSMDLTMSRVHEDDRAMLDVAVAAAMDPDGDGEFAAEYRVRWPDESLHWIDARGRALFGYRDGKRTAIRFVGTVLDVTERKKAEEALREEALLVETLQRIGSSLTAELNLERIVQTVTDEATKLTAAQFGAFFYNVLDERGERYTLYSVSGVPRAAFEQFPMPRNTAVFEPTFRGTGIVRSDDITKDPRYGHNEPYFGMPKGHLPVVSYLAVPVVSHSGEVLGGLFFGHEHPCVFTERHERLAVGIAGWAAVAMDNARLYASEKRARTDAERANAAKAEFLAAMSHDLRTPLNAIGGYAQLVEEGVYGPASEQQRQTMQRIRRAQAHLLTLINDILNFARIEAGRLQLHLEDVPIDAAVSEITALIEPQLAAKGLQFEHHVRAPDARVRADRERLQQILLNLLTNSVKFTDAGSVLLEATATADTVALHVRDTGSGIERERLATIFDPFVQAGQSREKTREGVGLGLAISRELARAMNGDVTVESELGVGSTFTVTLPRATGTVLDSPPPSGVRLTTEPAPAR